jgi:hypothetical protein
MEGDNDQPILTDEQLATLLERLNKQAVGYLSDEVAVDSDNNLDRYLGKPFGDEEEGLSQAMSMDVAEVVDWALPDLLEPFISGNRVVEFEANSEADEKWISDAADLANHVFYVQNDGITLLYDTIKTGLIQKIGFTKTWWEEEEKDEEQTVTGLAILNVQELQQDQSIKITDIKSEPMGMTPVDPQMAAAFEDGNVYTVSMTKTKKCGQVRIHTYPPEQIKVSSRAAELRTIDYIAHESEVHKWKLVAMGFDPEVVKNLKSERKFEQSREDHRFPDEMRQMYESTMMLQDIVTLIEEYPMLDLDNDGDAERWQIFRVGKTILSKEEVCEHPFDCWTADRIPHRLIGLGLADKVKQTQKIKTSLTRDLLNNIYLANRPRTEIPESAIGADTIDDLLNIRIGGLIRTKVNGQMQTIQTPDRTGATIQAITYMDGVREQQSGITRNGLAVSSEVIDPKSATESNRQDRNEQVRKRLMCRMIAETFLVPLFRKILRNLVTYQDASMQIKVAGRWTEMDPRGWNADAKARVSVGLGHANKEEMLQAAMTVAQAQVQAFQVGLCTKKHLYNTSKKLVSAVGWNFVDEYFLDPESPEAQQLEQQKSQQPDPKMLEVQGKMQAQQAIAQSNAQIQQQKAATDAQIREAEMQAKLQLAEAEAQMKARLEQMKAASETNIAMLRTRAELALAAQQQQDEMALAEKQQQDEMRLAEKRADSEARIKSQQLQRQNIPEVRFGGKVG